MHAWILQAEQTAGAKAPCRHRLSEFQENMAGGTVNGGGQRALVAARRY